jgi:aspartyl-tRNA(Asn)/glutamyl-tRNA(Gln) amidotransferase subunit C
VEQLSEVNTDGVEPMTSVVHARLPQRQDGVNDGGMRDSVLKNAPNAEHGFFAVPKVIE